MKYKRTIFGGTEIMSFIHIFSIVMERREYFMKSFDIKYPFCSDKKSPGVEQQIQHLVSGPD